MVFLDPTNDVAFKKLFGEQTQKEVLIHFLNTILDRKDGEMIKEITYNDPYNHPETSNLKLSIVDVLATDQNGKNYIIEVQVDNQQDYGLRAQYYSSLAVARQLDRAEKYGKLVPVIFVGVLDFILLHSTDYLSHHFVINQQNGQNELKLMEWHFIELKKFALEIEQLKTVTEKWVYLLKNAKKLDEIPASLKETKQLQLALQTLNKAAWSDRELYDYDKRRDEVLTAQSKIETAIAEGLAKGIAQGIAQGVSQGERQEAFVIAQKMINENLDIGLIIHITGLSHEDIKQIKKSKK